MPLVHVHVIRGRSPEDARKLLDAVHCAVVEVLRVPDTDRYQILHQHEAYEMIALDTGLGFERTSALVMVQVISKTRTAAAKQQLYRSLAHHLERECAVAAADLVVAVVENGEADWSFGGGEAQFLTAAL